MINLYNALLKIRCLKQKVLRLVIFRKLIYVHYLFVSTIFPKAHALMLPAYRFLQKDF